MARRALFLSLTFLASAAWGHCDSLEGPVVQDARRALDSREVTPALKWVSAEREGEIRDAFALTLAVRERGNDARELADRHFFETLVRVHRAGEGEQFAGLKPASEIDAGIAAADRALASGSPDELTGDLVADIGEEIRKRFAAASERRKHAEDSVEAGRAYVQAYVDYIHFVESVNRLATRGASHVHLETEP
jgi:hypothetical protein